MKVKLALLADCANVTPEGKLNILGIFDRINVAKLPAVHPQLQLVLWLEARPSEKDRKHAIEIRLQGPGGETVFELNGEVVPRGGKPDETVSSNQIITVNNLTLKEAGSYTFAVFVNNDLKKEMLLKVDEVPPREKKWTDPMQTPPAEA